ncbi:thiamine pyrophosphate enzyme, N-terminal TPP binding domain-containing protein [Phyllosticta citribraziliensis]|uniref:Thiamine pyrophosphate enzyme, N-terminal TPP binding domain-containing protein n=1 Tax=Phyllosticta citribraziliensis TaxID=989973 RepID=A0ABR1LHJ6_9PEZI
MSFSLKYPVHRELTGGDLLAQCLRQIGVEVAFGLHGGHLDAFLVGCDYVGIRLVDTRHETVAVQAAEGYSKMTGKTGVCFVTANSGYSNGLPGLATALADRSSIFCITSSVPLRDQENNSLQGQIDQVVAARPLTKFAHRVIYAEDIPRIVAHAIHVSTAGAPGPVLVDFPIDVLFAPVEASRISWGAITSPLPFPPGPSMSAVNEALLLLKEAKRPAIIFGSGARSASAVKALLEFSKSTQIPVFHNGKFCFLFPLYESPVFAGSADALGLLKRVGSAPPDCLLLLGARTGMYLGGRGGSIIPEKDCKIIQVDTDGGEIGRTCAVDVGVVANVGQTLQALNVGLSKIPVQVSPEWIKLATALKDIPTPFEKEPRTIEDGKMHPYHALAALLSLLPPDPIIVFDGGECASWAAMAAKLAKPHTIVSSTGYLGFLGSGFGQALGCAVAAPHQMIVNIQGDGSAGFHFMDLDSYARHGLNVLTVVVNNHCWGMSANGQDLVYGEKIASRPVSSLSPKTDYAMIARGLGNSSAKVDQIGEIEPALMEVLSQDGPSCIELLVSRKPTHPVTKSMVGASEDKNIIVVPYYENVPRPRYG